MGWKGTLRTVGAIHRAAQRDAVRRNRDAMRAANYEAKVDALRAAAEAVDAFDNLIERLTSIHKDCGERWFWEQYIKAHAPETPSRLSHHENAAREAITSFKPSLLDRVLRRAESKRERLHAAMTTAVKRDDHDFETAEQDYRDQYENWEQMKSLATRVIALEVDALKVATESIDPFSEIAELGSHVQFYFLPNGIVAVDLSVNSEGVIPADTYSLLQSRKLSVKKMPVGRFYEIYQDYVAGATIRIARELFALLPIETVYVTAKSKLLDRSTGHLTDQPILSAMFPRVSMEAIRFENVDPSEAMRNFNHRVDFRKTKGFSAVESLAPKAASS